MIRIFKLLIRFSVILQMMDFVKVRFNLLQYYIVIIIPLKKYLLQPQYQVIILILKFYPNAVLDGLHEQSQLSWLNKNSQKFVILLTQVPPHGHLKYQSFDDNYPKGCPCNLKEIEVLKNYKMKQIHLIIPKLSCYQIL
ncbi:unnamed protein product [Paramecium sonneborni]|uniref:Uncharacterized protein n=1 Tax=Paramecium sonneborni TaxID=65129 RepID=A0A8S1N667_9CILI|nr:unnamed protein product [Paramecium sonneborni]